MLFNITSNCNYITVTQIGVADYNLSKNYILVNIDTDIIQITDGQNTSIYFYINYTDITVNNVQYSSTINLKTAIDSLASDRCLGYGTSVWLATMSQYDKDAPTVDFLWTCELQSNITWTRISIGTYEGTSIGSFSGSTHSAPQNYIFSSGTITSREYIQYSYTTTIINDNTIRLYTSKTTIDLISGISTTLSDNLIIDTIIKIEIANPVI